MQEVILRLFVQLDTSDNGDPVTLFAQGRGDAEEVVMPSQWSGSCAGYERTLRNLFFQMEMSTLGVNANATLDRGFARLEVNERAVWVDAAVELSPRSLKILLDNRPVVSISPPPDRGKEQCRVVARPMEMLHIWATRVLDEAPS